MSVLMRISDEEVMVVTWSGDVARIRLSPLRDRTWKSNVVVPALLKPTVKPLVTALDAESGRERTMVPSLPEIACVIALSLTVTTELPEAEFNLTFPPTLPLPAVILTSPPGARRKVLDPADKINSPPLDVDDDPEVIVNVEPVAPLDAPTAIPILPAAPRREVPDFNWMVPP